MRTHPHPWQRRGSRGTVPRHTAAAALRPLPITDIAPHLRGLSVTGMANGTVYTWSATDDTFAALDACQYLSGGPCVQAATEGMLVATLPGDLVDEGPWQLFATAAVAAGVGATMSLPVRGRGRGGNGPPVTIGTVNLYGGPADTFRGRHQLLVDWCAHWPPAAALGAIGDAFAARRATSYRSEPHRDQNAVDWAVAMLATRLDLDVAVAADKLSMAACRAGLRESVAAVLLTDLLHIP
jgi:hypothetical protein